MHELVSIHDQNFATKMQDSDTLKEAIERFARRDIRGCLDLLGNLTQDPVAAVYAQKCRSMLASGNVPSPKACGDFCIVCDDKNSL